MATVAKKGKVFYAVYQTAEGKQKWVRGSTDKTATKRLAERLETEKHAIKRGDIDPKLEQRKIERAKSADIHIDGYRDALGAKGDDPNHIAYTIADIRRFMAHAGATHSAAVNRGMVDRWVLDLQKPYTVKLKSGVERVRTRALRTVNRHVRSLQGFLKHLQRLGTITEYPLMGYPQLKTRGHEKRRRRALSMDEQVLLLKHAGDRADIYRFALLTGCRLNQLQKLRVRDLDFSAGTVSLSAKDASHSGKLHIVGMHPHLVPILKARCELKMRDAVVFPDAPTKDQAATWVRSDCTTAGIDTTDIDFYALRHTFGSTLASKGAHPKVLQALMGHSDIETTLGYYVHFKRADEKSALLLLTA